MLLFHGRTIAALLAPMEGVARIEAHSLMVLLLELVTVPAAEAGARLERAGRHAVVPAVGQPAARGAAAASVLVASLMLLLLLLVGISLGKQ
jgi:hypothetical protein